MCAYKMPEVIKRNITCETCGFLQERELTPEEKEYYVYAPLECRRFPPRTVVRKIDWCGEYRPKGGGF